MTAPSTGRGGWVTVGGTSLGAPAWAGLVAVLDEGLATVGKGSLDGRSETLPALYSASPSAFRSVIPNGFTGRFGLSAGNPVTQTGLGTPNASALIAEIVAKRGYAPPAPIAYTPIAIAPPNPVTTTPSQPVAPTPPKAPAKGRAPRGRGRARKHVVIVDAIFVQGD